MRHAFGRQAQPDALQDHVRQHVRQPTLLLLDNFEHLVLRAPLLVTLLEACIGLTIFVTSRAVLRVSGEHEYLLPPLPLPNRTARRRSKSSGKIRPSRSSCREPGPRIRRSR